MSQDQGAEDHKDHEEAEGTVDRPYHTKRPHKKSRRGCYTCKRRKVKCDESRPKCRACTLRKEVCIWPDKQPEPQKPATSSSPSASPSLSAYSSYSSNSSNSSGILVNPSPAVRSDLEVTGYAGNNSQLTRTESVKILFEPTYTPVNYDETDMKLLWFFTSKGYDSFAVEAGREPTVDAVLTKIIPQHALANSFLMNCLLGASALHLNHLKSPIPDKARELSYLANAFEGYRRAVNECRPETFPALLAGSLFLCALSSQRFRDPDGPPLYIVEWIVVWRGIRVVMDIISPRSLIESGLAGLFTRPPLDLNTSAAHIPNNLLFMVSSMTTQIPSDLLAMVSSLKLADGESEHVDSYYAALKYLGSLYQELELGLGPIMDLRTVVWFTFLPESFIDLSRQKKRPALVIIAHYLCFVKLIRDIWWMEGIAEKEILDIYNEVGEEWHQLLEIPMKIRLMTDKDAIVRILLNNVAWERPKEDLYEKDRDTRTKALSVVDDSGQSLCWDGNWFKQDKTSFDAVQESAKQHFGVQSNPVSCDSGATSPSTTRQSSSTSPPSDNTNI